MRRGQVPKHLHALGGGQIQQVGRRLVTCAATQSMIVRARASLEQNLQEFRDA